jgi:hypothetical protein
MLMANRNVHVFNNDISGNKSTGVAVVGYPREIKDAKYEPLPRDIVVRDNRFGRNGWDPAFGALPRSRPRWAARPCPRSSGTAQQASPAQEPR